MHNLSSFITLTFSDNYLPEDYSVSVRDIQLFIKRYRKYLGHSRIRYFACGEYGDEGGRPHYHILAFGHDFPDKKPWRRQPSGEVLYRSEILEKLWPYGNAEVGTVTAKSIAYVSRYILKKITGDAAADHYCRVHPVTGELVSVRPEFVTMSRRPGIGAGWFEKFAGDAFPSDFVVIDGVRKAVPRFYMEREKKQNEDKWGSTPTIRQMQPKRAQKRKLQAPNNTLERRRTREQSLHLKVSRYKRDLDKEQ